MQYCILSELGSGGFGTVYKVCDRNTSRLYAVKILVPPNDPWDRAMTLAQRGEGSILPTLDHPHIIRAFGSDGWGTSQVEIVLNLMDGNLASLAYRLARPRALLAKQVLRQMLRALAHLSALGYVHRDIKPENIFFVRVGGLNDDNNKDDDYYDNGCSPLAYPFHFRLGDFGLCEHKSRIGPNEVHGTTSFLAPELLLGNGSSGGSGPGRCRRWGLRWQRQSHKSDVWALYVTVLWVLDLDTIWIAASLRGGRGDAYTFARNLAGRVNFDCRIGALTPMAEVDPRRRASAGKMLDLLSDGTRIEEIEYS